MGFFTVRSIETFHKIGNSPHLQDVAETVFFDAETEVEVPEREPNRDTRLLVFMFARVSCITGTIVKRAAKPTGRRDGIYNQISYP